jgi:hypothetical protein
MELPSLWRASSTFERFKVTHHKEDDTSNLFVCSKQARHGGRHFETTTTKIISASKQIQFLVTTEKIESQSNLQMHYKLNNYGIFYFHMTEKMFFFKKNEF